MKRVFVINGPGRSGKDTFIDLIRENLVETPVFSYSSVDEVKAYLKEHEGWDGVTKDEQWRKRMYDLKMEMVANNNRPNQYLMERVNLAPDNSVIFLHIREPSEILNFLQACPTAETILVERDMVEKFYSPADNLGIHRSIPYTHYIANNGDLDGLNTIAKQFIESNLNDFLSESDKPRFK